MDFLTFFIDRGAVSGAFHTSSLLAQTRHCLLCLSIIWSAGKLRQKPVSTQSNRAFCPERCVESYSFPSTLRVRKQTHSQTTFYLHGHCILFFSNSVFVSGCASSLQQTLFSFCQMNGEFIWNSCISFPKALLFCYFVIVVFVVVLQGEKKKCRFCQKALFNLLFPFNRIWKSLCLKPSPLSSVSTVNFRTVLMEAQKSFSPSHCCLCVHFNIQPHNHFSAFCGRPAIVQKAQILFNIHIDSLCNYGFSFWSTWSRVSSWHFLKRQHV